MTSNVEASVDEILSFGTTLRILNVDLDNIIKSRKRGDTGVCEGPVEEGVY